MKNADKTNTLAKPTSPIPANARAIAIESLNCILPFRSWKHLGC